MNKKLCLFFTVYKEISNNKISLGQQLGRLSYEGSSLNQQIEDEFFSCKAKYNLTTLPIKKSVTNEKTFFEGWENLDVVFEKGNECLIGKFTILRNTCDPKYKECKTQDIEVYLVKIKI